MFPLFVLAIVPLVASFPCEGDACSKDTASKCEGEVCMVQKAYHKTHSKSDLYETKVSGVGGWGRHRHHHHPRPHHHHVCGDKKHEASDDEKNVNKQKQYEAALVMVCKYYPSQAPQIKKYWHEIINGLMGQEVPGKVVYQSFQVPLNSSTEHLLGSSDHAEFTPTPCQEDVAKFIISAIDVLGGFMDLPKIPEGPALKIVFKNLGPDVLKGMATMIDDFKDAPNIEEQAIALVEILNRLYAVGGPLLEDVLFGAIENMKWYNWAEMAAEITAQLVAWFATDSLALIAEIALALEGLPGLFEAADAVAKACSS